MAVPVVEVATFVASEAYKKDPSVIFPALDLLKTIPGCIGIWYGLQVQDPSYLYLVVLWETLEHHTNYMKDTVEYPKLGAALQPSMTDFLGLYHVRFPEDIQTALNAPTTEIVHWTIPESTNVETFHKGVQQLIDLIQKDMPGEVFRGGVGRVVEGERRLSVILGWHSLERFTQAVYNNQQCVELVTELKKQADLDLKHAQLKKFTKN